MRSTASGHHEQVIAMGTELRADREVTVQRLSGRRMKRQEPTLAELGIADDEPVLAEVIAFECQGFGYAQAGRSQQTEEMMVRMRPDRTFGSEVERGVHDGADVVRLQQMRRWAWPLPSPEGTSRRNFIASILGMEKDAEESDGVEEGACTIWRGSQPTPIKDAVRLKVLIPVLLRVTGKLP
jgi:hypothetical protein